MRLDRDQIAEAGDAGGVAAGMDQGRGRLAQVEPPLLERARPQRPQRPVLERALAGEPAQPGLDLGLEGGRERGERQDIGPAVARLLDELLRPARDGLDRPVPQPGRGLVRDPLVADEAVVQDRGAEAIEHGLVDRARLDPLPRAVVHQARERGPVVPGRQQRIECRPGRRERVQRAARQDPAAGQLQALQDQALDVGPAARG